MGSIGGMDMEGSFRLVVQGVVGDMTLLSSNHCLIKSRMI
jgi:hypothetical protein